MTAPMTMEYFEYVGGERAGGGTESAEGAPPDSLLGELFFFFLFLVLKEGGELTRMKRTILRAIFTGKQFLRRPRWILERRGTSDGHLTPHSSRIWPRNTVRRTEPEAEEAGGR